MAKSAWTDRNFLLGTEEKIAKTGKTSRSNSAGSAFAASREGRADSGTKGKTSTVSNRLTRYRCLNRFLPFHSRFLVRSGLSR